MLFGETAAVYCENHKEHTVWAECGVRTSQETVAVYCENHTEHTDTLCGQSSESVPHRKHITSPLQSPTG
jgi:hypothetical protein